MATAGRTSVSRWQAAQLTAPFEGTETEARLWEIAENLHRADVTVQERAEHISEWVRLTEASEGFAQVAQNPKGGRAVCAERRMGEELAKVELATGGDAMRARSSRPTELSAKPTLAEIGISKDQSSRYQHLAAIAVSSLATASPAASTARRHQPTGQPPDAASGRRARRERPSWTVHRGAATSGAAARHASIRGQCTFNG